MASALDAVALCERMATRARGKEMLSAAQSQVIVAEKKQLSLPFQWGEGVRGTPNILIRGALFGVVRSGQRSWLKHEQIFCAGGYTIIYSGEQLDQGDLDIWQQAIHFCRSSLGEFVACSKKQLLRALGRSDGKENKRWLMRGLDRLVAGSAKLIDMRVGTSEDPRQFNDNLLGYSMDGDQLLLRVSRAWAMLFLRDTYTLIDWERRLSLPARAQLARWLHDFYSSHAKPYPLRVDTLRAMCGSKTGDIHKFRDGLREALDCLKRVQLLSDWKIDPHRDLVTVRKNASPSQNRYLLRQIKGG